MTHVMCKQQPRVSSVTVRSPVSARWGHYPGLCTPSLGAAADACRRLPTAADACRRLTTPADSFFFVFGVGCEELGGAARWPAPRAATR
eukprot:236640-Chlamydomonas_euryale.AAC.1